MPSPEAMEAFAGVGAFLIFLGGVAFALQRLGILKLGGRPAAPAPGVAVADAAVADAERISGDLCRVRKELSGLALRVAEIEGRLPQPEALGRVHHRIDDLVGSVAHVEGELQQINHTLHLIQGVLLGDRT